MATTVISGSGGSVTIGTNVWNMKANTWSATMSGEKVYTTGFADGGFRTSVIVEMSMNGSIGGVVQYDGSNTAPIPSALVTGSSLAVGAMQTATTATITLTATTGCTYQFSATIDSVQFDRPAAGVMTATLNFESTGLITQTWDESA